MKQFTVLKNNGDLMKRLGYFSHESLASQSNDFFKSPWTYYVFFIGPAFILSTGVFMWQNVTSQLNTVLRTGIVLLGESQSFGVFNSIGNQMQNIKTMHLKLQKIVDESAQDGEHCAVNIYWMSELKCRKFTTIMTYYIGFHVNACVIATFKATFDICFGTVDTSNWDTPFNVVVPFSTESISGWFLRWFFELTSSFTYVITAASTTSYFVSFCLYIDAICNHFNQMINSIPRLDESEGAKMSREQKINVRQNISEQMHQAIALHNELFEVFKLAREISSGTIFFFLPINGVVLGLTMYTMEHSEFDVIVFGFDVICTTCTLVWLALFCYHANFATDRVTGLGYNVYDLNWFEYPVELQKYAILVIAHSQEPVYFVGFNLIRCTMEVFGKIIKSSCSYYIIFRSLSQ